MKAAIHYERGDSGETEAEEEPSEGKLRRAAAKVQQPRCRRILTKLYHDLLTRPSSPREGKGR